MRVDTFHYELPAELIAQHPADRREDARLMRLGPDRDGPTHQRVSDLAELVPSGSVVVVNDTRVVPARLVGRKRATGGRVEVLLVRRVGIVGTAADPSHTQRWRALAKSSRPLKFPVEIEVPSREPADEPLLAHLMGRSPDDGLLDVILRTASGARSIDAAIRACGRLPLPPYVRRDPTAADDDRYQTVYARHDGAVAAPTAGLHLTHSLLDQLRARGCETARVTLHVSLGTFRPVQVADLDDHPMHAEAFQVSQQAVAAIDRARDRDRPVVAIGTTTARALESSADPDRPGRVRAADTETRLLIQPGYRWRVVDVLLTNFHLPRSTLLALVCSFGGSEAVLEAYRIAVRERYRFFSYGDAMLTWRAP